MVFPNNQNVLVLDIMLDVFTHVGDSLLMSVQQFLLFFSTFKKGTLENKNFIFNLIQI